MCLSKSEDIERFYDLIRDIEKKMDGIRYLRDFDVKGHLPEAGVYFMFEEGEFRSDLPNQLRVTRVGTHATHPEQRTSLKERLEEHRGIPGGRGVSRRSVLRRHVGLALINESQGQINIPTWGRRGHISAEQRQQEELLERLVTSYVGEMMVLWLPVPGIDRAAYDKRRKVEKNSIALLSNRLEPFDKPSKEWLGLHHPKDTVRRSGLWNIQHVYQAYDPLFLDDMMG
jgi:hypothetical protein